jgi:DNA-binding FrmR family transcriptional regulator
MKIQSDATRDDLQKRLRRIEGQMRGIQKMLDDDRECAEIVQQLNAAQAALRNATSSFMNAHARECLMRSSELPATEQAALVDELFGLMSGLK